MTDRVKCPVCLAMLALHDGAPEIRTCPKCLSPLVNPNSRRKELGSPQLAAPIEYDVNGDLRQTRAVLMALSVGLMIGGVIFLFSIENGPAIGVVTIGVGALVGVLGVVLDTSGSRNSDQHDLRKHIESPSIGEGTQVVLEYATPSRYVRSESEPEPMSYIMGFVIQFVGGIGLTYAVDGTRGTPSAKFITLMLMWFLLFTGCLLVGIWIGSSRQHWGFMKGSLIGFFLTGGLCGLLYAACGFPYQAFL